MVELTQVRRQNLGWAREATQQLAKGRTRDALQVYADHGAVSGGATREEAQKQLLAAWTHDAKPRPMNPG